MESYNPLEIGGIIGVVIILAQGLVGVTKLVITKKLNNKEAKSTMGCQAVFPEEQKAQLKTLHDLHSRFDDDGSPLWYVPRSWGETQSKIAELLHDVSRTQESQTKILDKIIDKLNHRKE